MNDLNIHFFCDSLDVTVGYSNYQICQYNNQCDTLFNWISLIVKLNHIKQSFGESFNYTNFLNCLDH